jgi:hypothetical protein
MVEVKGARELRKSLRKYQPDLAKELNKEMASYLSPVARQARSYLPLSAPLSNWGKETSSADTINYRAFPKYNALKARRGIGYTTSPSKPNRKGFSYLAQIFNSEASGAIYETAGRKNPNGQPWVGGNKNTSKKFSHSLNPNAGYQFIHSMPELYNVPQKANQSGKPSRKMTGRAIFRAWAETNGQVTPKVIKAMENAKIKFNNNKKAA